MTHIYDVRLKTEESMQNLECSRFLSSSVLFSGVTRVGDTRGGN